MKRTPERLDPAATELLDVARHPLRTVFDELRGLILAVDPRIRESVKWNAPSFALDEHFATLANPASPRSRDRVECILHTGTKVRGKTMQGKIADPAGLLRWLAKDRAIVAFTGVEDLAAKRKPLQAVLRSWIANL